MVELRTFVIETATRRLIDLGYQVPSDLASYVEEVEFSINNYCNTNSVAAELKFTWVNMVVDYLRWQSQIAKANSGSEASPGDSSTTTILSSLKEGDTTLGFAADTAGKDAQEVKAHKIENALDQVVMNYQNALNRVRKVVW